MEDEVSAVNSSVPNVANDVTSYAADVEPTTRPPATRHIPYADQPSDAPNEIMKRTRKLASFTWSSGAAFGRTTQFFPQTELFNSLATIVNVTNFTYLTYKGMKLRFTPNTTKFYRGMLGITFLAQGRSPSVSNYVTPTALSSLPTTYLDASSCTAVEVITPFVLPNAKVVPADLQSGTNETGMLVIWVVDPLVCETAPGESTSITLNIEASFIEPALHDPQPNGMVSSVTTSRITHGCPAGEFANAQGYTDPVSREADNKARKGTISSALATTSKIAASVSSFPVVGSFASGLSVAANVASSVADFLGLAKPMNLMPPQWVQKNPLPYAAVADGVITGDVLSMEQIPFVATEPSFVASDVDETSFLYMRSRPTLIQRFQTLGLLSDTPVLMGVIPVAPAYGWTNPNFQPSNVAVQALCSKLWSGDLSYKFVIPANPLTRCRLAIMHSIKRQTVFTENSRYMYIDVEGTTVVDGVIPWVKRYPAQEIPTMGNTNTPVHVDKCNGYLHIFQVSNLIADSPSITPTPLSVLCFVNADENLRFYGYKSPTFGAALTKGGAQPAAFLGLSSSVRIDRLLAEDNIQSIRQIFHRMQFNSDTSILAPSTTATYTPTLPRDFEFFMYMFRWWRGSVSLTYTLTNGGTKPQDRLAIGWATGGTDQDMDVFWYYNQNPRQTFTTPFLLGAGVGVTGATQTRTGLPSMSIRNVGTDSVAYYTSVSFNDDFTLGVPLPSYALNYT